MKFQRLSILVFAAALTAGTCAATSFVTFQLSGNGGGTNQSASLSIDGVPLGSGSGNGATSLYYGTQQETDGWHSIAIDYQNISGLSGLTFFVNGSWGPSLASYDAAGSTINGLTGVYSALDGTTHLPTTQLFIDYGEGLIHYTGGAAPWSGTYGAYTFTATSAFEEKLSGFIYLGTGTGLLSDVPPSQQTPPPSDPPPSDAPEPAGWWLMAAALPLMLFSKLRLRRAKACQ
jgi:hypothetical protein